MAIKTNHDAENKSIRQALIEGEQSGVSRLDIDEIWKEAERCYGQKMSIENPSAE